MKLRGKLQVAFTAALLPLLLLIGFSFIALSQLSQSINEMHDEGLAVSNNLVRLSTMTENTRVNMLQAVLNEDPSNSRRSTIYLHPDGEKRSGG
ncbi:hypothetical protein BTO30_12260 [Domibacillus antri]|uniref:Uncharacterized protein n=1 Tax=Domibacillus antri TaxID=1714264 RepID=A0A1Q8Q3N0_9BACI|nr:MCP four helix bundle domain-containing protein [Domibacillus antri]OLN21966.1 hypothetical protein BTO30_12260 [Domibacillus antri]